MSCLKNRVLKLITLINGISFLYFGSLLDSYSWIPGIICCINFAWLTLFAYANGYTYKSEKGEEMEEIKEQKKTACEFLLGTKRTEYIADITELVYNLISGICDVSDKYQVDRDSSMRYAASIITEIATTASIQKFETELMKKGE